MSASEPFTPAEHSEAAARALAYYLGLPAPDKQPVKQPAVLPAKATRQGKQRKQVGAETRHRKAQKPPWHRKPLPPAWRRTRKAR